MTSFLRRLTAWLLRLVPSDQDLEAAENERREQALRDFHNRMQSERLRRRLTQTRERGT